MLHTIGAKSGEPRDAPLMYTADGKGRAIVAGTNWAGAKHPAWTANLLAHPDAEITVRGRRMAVHATLIPDAERDATWARMEAQWPDYRTLRARLRAHGAALPAHADAPPRLIRSGQGLRRPTVRGRTISQSDSTPMHGAARP